MTKSKHTPGPWFAAAFSSVVGCPIMAQPNKNENMIVVAGTRSAVSKDASGFRAEVEANARLMAAAPELFDAAIEALETLERLAPNVVMDAKDSLRIAIRKATEP